MVYYTDATITIDDESDLMIEYVNTIWRILIVTSNYLQSHCAEIEVSPLMAIWPPCTVLYMIL